jgi:hypothetical protein
MLKVFLPKQLLNFIKHDVWSTTGINLRKILLLTKKTNVEQLSKIDASSVKYHEKKRPGK